MTNKNMVAALLMLVLLTSVATAQATPATENRAERLELMRERVSTHMAQVVERAGMAITRLEGILDRVETKITEAANPRATAIAAEARAAIEQAKEGLVNFQAKVTEALAAASPRLVMVSLRANFKAEFIDNLIVAKTKIAEAIAALKGENQNPFAPVNNQ